MDPQMKTRHLVSKALNHLLSGAQKVRRNDEVHCVLGALLWIAVAMQCCKAAQEGLSVMGIPPIDNVDGITGVLWRQLQRDFWRSAVQAILEIPLRLRLAGHTQAQFLLCFEDRSLHFH